MSQVGSLNTSVPQKSHKSMPVSVCMSQFCDNAEKKNQNGVMGAENVINCSFHACLSKFLLVAEKTNA